MRILVLGSGAREHAILRALAAEAESHDLFAAPGNAGTAADAANVDLDILDGDAVLQFSEEHAIALVVIGPEAPLIAGVADTLRERGIATFGPGRAAAQIEGSKAFAKNVMERADVPTGRAVSVTSRDELERALTELGAPYVVKADGLASGKGVIVTDDRGAAIAHAERFLHTGSVLVEEYLDGEEVSLFFVADGDTVRPLSPAQDYKRAYDGDAGPNTGGMGAYSPLPWLADRFGSEQAFVDEVSERVALPVIRTLDRDGTPFIGLLYAGLIVTHTGIRVIEFNARFGDPETQVVLARLATPLSHLLFAAATGTLESEPAPGFRDDAAVTVVLASEGYPDAPITARAITGVSGVTEADVVHAATADVDGELVATGGRVLSVVGLAPTIAEARERAYRGVEQITLEGSHYRGDIATL